MVLSQFWVSAPQPARQSAKLKSGFFSSNIQVSQNKGCLFFPSHCHFFWILPPHRRRQPPPRFRRLSRSESSSPPPQISSRSSRPSRPRSQARGSLGTSHRRAEI